VTDHSTLVALRLAAVALGGLLAWRALRLANRSPENRRTYTLLAAGFALVATAAVVEGALFEFAGWALPDAATIEACLSAAGFAAILVAVRRSGV
jgi:hypothetical protein